MKAKIELYIQLVKVLETRRSFDERSRNQFAKRYEAVFGRSYNGNFEREEYKAILDTLEQIFNEQKLLVLESLKDLFNTKHNQLQNSSTYNAISYEETSIVREILQNILDREYTDDINIDIKFNDATRTISFKYNEKGFDWKSLIFYFNAGDSAKAEEKTGKFGLGIKSVMYNTKALSVKSKSLQVGSLSWKVERTVAYENESEVKKALELNDICQLQDLTFDGTEVSITFEEDKPLNTYYAIKNNLLNLLTNTSNSYLDIPELIFAFYTNNAQKLTISIDNQEIIFNKDKDKSGYIEANNIRINFLMLGLGNSKYIKEILYFLPGPISFNNEGLYATYRLIHDKTYKNYKCKNIFVSVKSEYIESHRKSLRNQDNCRNEIIKEAEAYIVRLFQAEQNQDLLTVYVIEKDGILYTEYSRHLQSVFSFLHLPESVEAIAKIIRIPEKVKDTNKPIKYIYHSAIAKVGHTRYKKYEDEEYSSNTLWVHQAFHDKNKKLFDYEIKYCSSNKKDVVLIVVDMFNALYDADKNYVDCSNITINSSYRMDNSFTQFIKCIYAKKGDKFTKYKIYGDRGSYCYYNDFRYFKNGSIDLYYRDFISLFSIIKRFHIFNEYDIKDLQDVLKVLLLRIDKPDIKEEDLEGLENVDKSLIKFYAYQIRDINEKIAQRNLSNNKTIVLEDILQIENYRALFINNPSIGINRFCNIEKLKLESFYTYFSKKADKLNKLISLNNAIVDLETKINNLLKSSYFMKLDRQEILSDEFIFIVLDENNQCVDIGKIQKNNIRGYNNFLSKHIVNDKIKVLCLTSRKNRLTDIIEMYVDRYITTYTEQTGQQNIARFFSSIDEIKINTVFSDQLPILYKLDLPLSKRSLQEIYIEFSKRIGYKSIYNDSCVKQEMIKDFTTAIYGNGYCCSIDGCDFSIPNEQAYEVAEILFRSYSLPILMCRNHAALLDKKNIQVIEIYFADKSIDDFIHFYKALSSDTPILGKYRNVKINYIEKYNSEIFDMDKEFDEEADENIVQSTLQVRLAPTVFSYWLNQIVL